MTKVNLGASPCKRLCKVDYDWEACAACGRTLDDLSHWRSMSLLERVIANAKAIRMLKRMYP